MFIAANVYESQDMEAPKCSLVDEYIKKMLCTHTHTHTHTHTEILLSH